MYLWAVNLQGDASIGPAGAPVNVKFSDVFNNLEGFLSANFEGVHNNRWGFIVDFSWMDISGNQGMATLNFEYIQFEVDGYYRVVTGRQTFDWLLGVRYYSHDLELIPTPVTVSEDWADPVIGARWTTPLAEKWTLLLRGDIGGFGAGSDLSWQERLDSWIFNRGNMYQSLRALEPWASTMKTVVGWTATSMT